uniref:CCHC-type domain-containing protein n=1 Tax=Cajanus cajan TaxID=3821 RepID=A0A151UHJ1_CAJCA
MDKLQRLKQGSSSVEEYRQSMELLMMRAGIREEERTTISGFQSGLNLEIRDKVELLPYRDLNELVQLCSRVEYQLNRKPFRKDSTHSYYKNFKKEGPSSTPFPNDKNKEKEIPSLKAPSKDTKTSDIKCFKCLGRGHIASQCPTKKTMILRGQDHYSSLNEATSSSSSDEEEVLASEEETYPCEGDKKKQKKNPPLNEEKEEKVSSLEASVSSKEVVHKSHLSQKNDIKKTLLCEQLLYLLYFKETLTAISHELDFVP